VLFTVTVVEEKLNSAPPKTSQSPADNVIEVPFTVVLLAMLVDNDADSIISPIYPEEALDPSITPLITFDVKLPVAFPEKTGASIIAPEVIVVGIEIFAPPLKEVAVPVIAPEIAIVLSVCKVVAVPALPVTLPVIGLVNVLFPVIVCVVSVVQILGLITA
jgi:hypothetical protein